MDTAHFHATLDALRDQLDVIDGQRQKVLHAIQAIEELVASPTPTRRVSASMTTSAEHLAGVQSNGSRAPEPTYTDAAVTVLKEIGKPTHVSELIRRFHAKGWFKNRDADDAKFRNSVLGSLSRDVREGGTLENFGRGVYGLRSHQGEQESTEIDEQAPDSDVAASETGGLPRAGGDGN